MYSKPLRQKPVDPKIAQLVSQHDNNPNAILTIFQTIQSQQGGLTPENIEDVARIVGVPAEKAHRAATFYSMLDSPPRPGRTIHICDGLACWLHNATKIRLVAEAELDHTWTVDRTSCLGLCDCAPAALVDDQPWGRLTPERLVEILSGQPEPLPAYTQPRQGELRVLLAQAGNIDPTSIDSALAQGAYRGLQQTLAQTPEEILTEIEAAGLLGRGGAGFPTGRKWRLVAQEKQFPKYIICNAHESEPLAFKDRALIDHHPHQIIEGMVIAAYAVGAETGIIHIRNEYTHQASLLEQAIQQAENRNWLGPNINNSGFSFQLHLHQGAGTYICGEETALLGSLEGKRGEPRLRPPYPTTCGYLNQPTVVNNVETLAKVPAILSNGANWYRSLSPAATPGTKLYTLLGHVQQPGLFEAPFGLTLRQIINDFGEGMLPDSTFNLALTGGVGGTLVPPDLLDLPIDYQSTAEGVSLGAGAFLICDQSISPMALVRELLHFFEVESCGKCTPCRVGTLWSRQILDRLLQHEGRATDLNELSHLADMMKMGSLCGLGQSAALPLRSALTHFPEVFKNAISRAKKNNEHRNSYQLS